MKKIQVISLFILTSIALLSSCTKEIKLNLNDTDSRIVIEGNVTNEPGPYLVRLSKTVNFSDQNIFPAVTNAFITIQDNVGNIDTLKETTSGSYYTTNITGTVGRTYTLKVITEGKTFTATSAMPSAVTLDSVTFLKSAFGGQAGSGNEIYVPAPRFLDPKNETNFYRFKTALNDTVDNGIYVDNDNLVNGLPYLRPIFSNNLFPKKNDSLLLEMQCINQPVYDYFFSLNAAISQGQGAATPSNPVSNIIGEGSLGYFSAHTVQRLKVEVK
jgi:hypothetical protein